VWLTQYFGREVYRFDPVSAEVCTYSVGAPSHYVVAGSAPSGMVWLGNWSNDRIYRLDPARGRATWWQITGANATPVGLALDDGGNLWWADSSQGILASLEPDSGRMTTYDLPLGSTPQMIVLYGKRVWYTDEDGGSLGALDPARAPGSTATLVSETLSLTPACRSLGPGTTAPVATQTGTLAWTSGTLEPALDEGGFTVYELPEGSSPYDLAPTNGFMWVTDRGRQKLLRLEVPDAHTCYLPMVFKPVSP
jgi:streptogramin lyase